MEHDLDQARAVFDQRSQAQQRRRLVISNLRAFSRRPAEMSDDHTVDGLAGALSVSAAATSHYRARHTTSSSACRQPALRLGVSAPAYRTACHGVNRVRRRDWAWRTWIGSAANGPWNCAPDQSDQHTRTHDSRHEVPRRFLTCASRFISTRTTSAMMNATLRRSACARSSSQVMTSLGRRTERCFVGGIFPDCFE
jgi:hypothetical protein